MSNDSGNEESCVSFAFVVSLKKVRIYEPSTSTWFAKTNEVINLKAMFVLREGSGVDEKNVSLFSFKNSFWTP